MSSLSPWQQKGTLEYKSSDLHFLPSPEENEPQTGITLLVIKKPVPSRPQSDMEGPQYLSLHAAFYACNLLSCQKNKCLVKLNNFKLCPSRAVKPCLQPEDVTMTSSHNFARISELQGPVLNQP